jgi:hypothetical protein
MSSFLVVLGGVANESSAVGSMHQDFGGREQ